MLGLMVTKQILVTGHVQGVGFRYFVLRTARYLGVDGAVWNRYDGGVELISCHVDPDVHDRFVKMLSSGPGRVTEVRVNDYHQKIPPGFVILDSR